MSLLSFYNYRWCDSHGTWHSGYPTSDCNYTSVQGSNLFGSWYDCTPTRTSTWSGTYDSYRWCDDKGDWHTGYPEYCCKFTQVEGCDDDGHWHDCTPHVALDGYVQGTSGNDLIDFNYLGDPQGDKIDHNDQILPGQGINDDIVLAGAGNDTVRAGEGNDLVYGGTGNDTLYGESGNDTLYGEDGNDRVFGGEGSDTLFGGAGNDELHGGDGPDTIFGDAGDDSIYGGAGGDTLFGGDGNDYIQGNQDDDIVHGGAGDDTILGQGGTDTLFGDAGNDSVLGGLDSDVIFGGDGNDTVNGAAGDDTVFGGAGDDRILGGGGNDTLFGEAGNDSITGDNNADFIFGGSGNDVIDAGANTDTVYAEDGEDTIIGGAGKDELYGGFGSDLFLGGNGGDNVVGGEDADGKDWDVLDLTGSNVDYIEYTSADHESGIVHFTDGSTMTFSEIENVVPCFTPGTTIATPRGEKLVEDLKVGDRVITRDNGIQEIAWIGQKRMGGAQFVRNPHLRPVLIKAGALGQGLPERDMMVSPNHRLLVASDLTQLYFDEREVLASAKHMVGATGIHTLDVMGTTYIHFMCARHEVVLSNGAWTESFQPGDYSLKGIGNAQRTEIFEIFPELATEDGLEHYQSARKSLKKHEVRLLVK